ncbi:hypothetical protein OG369_37405 [Streptomyces sp. NBC_01221]|uniref:hypothetical protein n=1 Tax=Streptomyces sp. NBC_01221 TaxID=2903782 RepID=UPI00224E97AE|nr:hypothetical protein [Streptomyces sp. NBC_01221]MCX4791578.1 hypothetical protein [Streptomyces sp. NBC_01221]
MSGRTFAPLTDAVDRRPAVVRRPAMSAQIYAVLKPVHVLLERVNRSSPRERR